MKRVPKNFKKSRWLGQRWLGQRTQGYPWENRVVLCPQPHCKSNPTQQLENPPVILLAPKFPPCGKGAAILLAPKFKLRGKRAVILFAPKFQAEHHPKL